jgi:hypothetical protein
MVSQLHYVQIQDFFSPSLCRADIELLYCSEQVLKSIKLTGIYTYLGSKILVDNYYSEAETKE